MQKLFPGTPIGKGSAWTVSEEFVSKLFGKFHDSVRGIMNARVIEVTGDVFAIDLRALVKFGDNSASHIQTTSFSGKAKVDAAAGKVLALEMDTISGCIRVKSGQGGYVALNDIALKVAGTDSKPSEK